MVVATPKAVALGVDRSRRINQPKFTARSSAAALMFMSCWFVIRIRQDMHHQYIIRRDMHHQCIIRWDMHHKGIRKYESITMDMGA